MTSYPFNGYIGIKRSNSRSTIGVQAPAATTTAVFGWIKTSPAVVRRHVMHRSPLASFTSNPVTCSAGLRESNTGNAHDNTYFRIVDQGYAMLFTLCYDAFSKPRAVTTHGGVLIHRSRNEICSRRLCKPWLKLKYLSRVADTA